jgi:uncharacterized protein YdhG (YjbR/CyaY superfamily)
MSEHSNGAIRTWRLIAEGVTVVVSILIAFALDAWWEQRQLAEEIREDLIIVETELTENVRLIDFNLDMMGRVVSASHSVTKAMYSDPGSAVVEVPGEWVYWGVFVDPTLDLSLGAIDAWIAAGRLAGIEDPELRRRLASVRGKVEDATEEQKVARDLNTRDLYPLMAEAEVDVRAIFASFAAGASQRPTTGTFDVPEIGAMRVPNGPAPRFLMQTRAMWYLSSAQEMTDLRNELKEIQVLLQEQLAH